MSRLKGESFFEYLVRTTEDLTAGLISYDEYGKKLLEEENNYSPDNWRKFYYIFNKLIPKILTDMKDTIEAETVLEALEERQKEAYKAEIRMRDQRRELRKYQTAEARYEHLLETVLSVMDEFEKPEPMIFGSYRNDSDENTSAVLMLSDWHAGSYIDNQFNYYNTEVMEERAKDIFEKAIRYGIIHKVGKLYIEINGDMIQGLINVSNRVQSEEDVAEQVVHVSKLLSDLINGLVPYFKEITVITTIGNHGRMFQDKTACLTKENFEKLVAEFLRLRLQEGIKLITSQAEDFTNYTINGKMICLAHGQYDKLNSVVKDFALMYKTVPDEIHLGHTHGYKDINDNDALVVVNGSLCGADDYAITLRKVTKPSQNFIVYGKDRCIYALTSDK